MNFAIEGPERRILVWLIWVVAVVVSLQPVQAPSYQVDQSVPLLGVVSYEQRQGWLFPWQPQGRWKQLALRHYRAWQRAVRQANRTAQLARLALRGALSLARAYLAAFGPATEADLSAWTGLRKRVYAQSDDFCFLACFQDCFSPRIHSLRFFSVKSDFLLGCFALQLLILSFSNASYHFDGFNLILLHKLLPHGESKSAVVCSHAPD